jgi:hypothetical protein
VTSCPLSTVHRITHTYIYFWIIINVTWIDISCGISAALPTLQITQNYSGRQFLFRLKYASFFNCCKRFDWSLAENLDVFAGFIEPPTWSPLHAVCADDEA